MPKFFKVCSYPPIDAQLNAIIVSSFQVQVRCIIEWRYIIAWLQLRGLKTSSLVVTRTFIRLVFVTSVETHAKALALFINVNTSVYTMIFSWRKIELGCLLRGHCGISLWPLGSSRRPDWYESQVYHIQASERRCFLLHALPPSPNISLSGDTFSARNLSSSIYVNAITAYKLLLNSAALHYCYYIHLCGDIKSSVT